MTNQEGGKAKTFPPLCTQTMIDIQEDKKITVLGLGNILLRDEGFGVHFVNWFTKKYRVNEDVRILDGGVLGYRLLDTVTSSSHLIVIDVIKIDDEPGAIYRFTQEELRLKLPDPTSAHEVEFPHVLSMAELIDECPEVIFLCIIPKAYGGDMDLEMTPLMHASFPRMEKLLLKELERLEVNVQEKT
jgi:hydrogenase maturation protease